METIEAINTCESIRRYLEIPVEMEKIQALLERPYGRLRP